MIPSALNSDFPKFVANQVLTSDNLNDLFGYLDEQERLTRTDLVGIGIVCGLQLKAGSDADGNYITITKGVGVTSLGYLVAVPEIKYHQYNQFDAVKCQYYDRFVNIGTKTQKFPLWELKQLGEFEDPDNPFHKLDDPSNFLNDKVVLIFVELLETNNKNCDPDSCDDKGTMVTVTFRPLLALKNDVDEFLSNDSNLPSSGVAVKLPDMKMPRYDVPSTLLLDSEDVFQAYQDILTTTFISNLATSLSNAYSKLSSLLVDEFPSDPFTDMASKFAFLNDGSIHETQVLNLQYFYDFFSDLYLAYDELRRKAYDVLCECLPDESLFPRHLLLGEAVGFDELKTEYRTRFISSPVLCCCADDARSVRALFRRLVVMIGDFKLVDVENIGFNRKELPIRITPSNLGKEPLSEKAIPFYYEANAGSSPLYLEWNPQRTEEGTADQNLSYNAQDYNASDDFVLKPLKYDLEPHNFLRIEGHIGQDYRQAMADISKLKLGNRLPFDVVALSSDTWGIYDIIDAIASLDTGSMVEALAVILKHPSCFSDIFLAFDEWINKLRCCLLESRDYFTKLPSFSQRAGKTIARDAVGEGETGFTIGDEYEARIKEGTINNKFCSDLFVEVASNKAHYGSTLVMMPFKIDELMSAVPEHITQLDAKDLQAKYADLTATSGQVRTMILARSKTEPLEGIDAVQLTNRLDLSCLTCLFLELKLLIREFLIRLLGLMIRQKLGFYAYKNPGIQHKAGVPLGGTFILVYHELSEKRQLGSRKNFKETIKSVNTRSGSQSPGFFSGKQSMLSSFLLLEEILFLQKINEIDEEPNELLDKIVGSIKPGTVIADFFVPYMCSSDCAPSQVVIMPPVEPPENRPPIADAGPDQEVVLSPDQNSVTLDGSHSSDPDGDPITFKWTFVSGPSTPVISSPDQEATTVTGFLEEGKYEFSLVVNDGKVDSTPDNVIIAVSLEIPASKSCGPLSGIIEDFSAWNKLAKDNPDFIGLFQSYGDVLKYFDALSGILSKPVEDQVNFFASGFNGTSIQELLIKWLTELNNIILEAKQFRLLALMLYRILNRLAMYIVCIQDADFDQAKVPMVPVFSLIARHVKMWTGQIAQGVFSAAEVAEVKNMGEDIKFELSRMDQNGETATKPAYVKLLKKILELILSIP